MEFSSTWQRHLASKCDVGCWYCMSAKEHPKQTFRFCPSEVWATYRNPRKEAKRAALKASK